MLLKATTYILNEVPTKLVAITPYDLWINKKPSLKNLDVWGGPTEARP